ncbi:MAG: sugar transferase [Woeseiaceae bacterium]
MRSPGFKRVFDIVFALCALIILMPAIAIIALFVLVGNGRPVLFSQLRPGLDSKPFRIYKFRTMSQVNESISAEDALRITKIGQFLRSTSLDELPELWNVLKGEMSFVGPRPLLMEYLPLYDARQARRHDIRPGITGWAQVNGRNLLSWEERFEQDIWYVDNWSLSLDLRILRMTVGKVLKREGISHQGEATMPRFTGSAR